MQKKACSNFSYYNPVNIIHTENWYDDLKSKLDESGSLTPLIVTSKGGISRLSLREKFEQDSIFVLNTSNPTFEDGDNIIKFCENKKFDSLVAIGGGSVMDLSKLAKAHICSDLSEVEILLKNKTEFKRNIKYFCIPTTHGTASEVTMWGTIWNINEKKKYSISDPFLYPDFALLDAGLTLTLPLDISIMTTMDALSHAFESIWNKNSNPVSTNHAIIAIKIILENAQLLKDNPNDINIRKNLLIASSISGLAFSNTATAAAHSISYPLTLNFNIPHGIASSITLVEMLDMNKKMILKEIDAICKQLEKTYEELRKSISKIPEGIYKNDLGSWNVDYNDLDMLTDQSFTKGRMDNNIVDLSRKDVKFILEKVLVKN
tara:strand:- start:5474 stop:6601 length:1128 start_codon:yes stop_codon:yes gene_type:complete